MSIAKRTKPRSWSSFQDERPHLQKHHAARAEADSREHRPIDARTPRMVRTLEAAEHCFKTGGEMNPIISMNHSPLTNRDWITRRSTPREDLLIAIKSTEMSIEGAVALEAEFPELVAKWKARLEELREQLRKMDEEVTK